MGVILMIFEEYADTELKKNVVKRLVSLNLYEEAILGALVAFEKDEQWQELNDYLDTGITDIDKIEDKISEIDEELYPDKDEE